MATSQNRGKKQITARIGPVTKNDENRGTNFQFTNISASTEPLLLNPGISSNTSNASMIHEFHSTPTTHFPSSPAIAPPLNTISTSYSSRPARQYHSMRNANPRNVYSRRTMSSTTSPSSGGNAQPLRPLTYGLRKNIYTNQSTIPSSYGDYRSDSNPFRPPHSINTTMSTNSAFSSSTPSTFPPPRISRSNEPLLTRASSSASLNINSLNSSLSTNPMNKLNAINPPLSRNPSYQTSLRSLRPTPLNRSQSAMSSATAMSMGSAQFTVPSISSTTQSTSQDVHSVTSQGTTAATQLRNLPLPSQPTIPPQQQQQSLPPVTGSGITGMGFSDISNISNISNPFGRRAPRPISQLNRTQSIPATDTSARRDMNRSTPNILTVGNEPNILNLPNDLNPDLHPDISDVPELVDSPPQNMKRRLQRRQKQQRSKRTKAISTASQRTQQTQPREADDDDDNDERMGSGDDSSDELPIISQNKNPVLYQHLVESQRTQSHCYNTRRNKRLVDTESIHNVDDHEISRTRKRSKSMDLPNSNLPDSNLSNSPNQFKCEVTGCGRTFPGRSSLAAHSEAVHVHKEAVQSILSTFSSFCNDPFDMKCSSCGDKWTGYTAKDYEQHYVEHHKLSPSLARQLMPSQYRNYHFIQHKCIVNRNCYIHGASQSYDDLVRHLVNWHQMTTTDARKIANIWRFKELAGKDLANRYPDYSRFRRLWQQFNAKLLSGNPTNPTNATNTMNSNRRNPNAESQGNQIRESSSPHSSVHTPSSSSRSCSMKRAATPSQTCASSQGASQRHSQRMQMTQNTAAAMRDTTQVLTRKNIRNLLMASIRIDQWKQQKSGGEHIEEQKRALFKVANGLLWACTTNGGPLVDRIGQNLIPLCGDAVNRPIDSPEMERLAGEVTNFRIQDILESRK